MTLSVPDPLSDTGARPSCAAQAHSLDPAQWADFRAQSHRMLDDILSYAQDIRQRRVWQPIPAACRAGMTEPLPHAPSDLADVHELFMRNILPYAIGNTHPGFMGWVHGGGTPVGMLAEMLAAGLNANLGGRDQMPVEVERQVVQWVRELFGFPATASGLFVTGTSMANLIAVLVARTAALGTAVRHAGVAAGAPQLVAYTSAGAHGCIAQAMDLSGLGMDALRRIPVNASFQIDILALQQAMAEDRRNGFRPFLVAGTAGTVDVGAIDDLTALADVAREQNVWFHVDGAYGALGMLAPDIAARLAGIERADSIAFDFHKWGQVPYDAGFILVRQGQLHHDTFAAPAAYLQRETRGMAAGSPWPCDFGPDLSRSFRALKTWFTIQVYGTDKLGAVISQTCELAQYLAGCIAASAVLELLAPVSLNIVCFRFIGKADQNAADAVSRTEACNTRNAQIVVALQEGGSVAPSSTTINGQLAIRAAIVNHRTQQRDLDDLIRQTIAIGTALSSPADFPVTAETR